MTSKLKLTVTEGVMRGKEFVFDEHDTFLMGRMEDCHICLPYDPCVSRHHFILEVNPPDARIRDLGSLNGTYINGKKYGGRQQDETPEKGAQREYPQVDIHDEDVIEVGNTVMGISLELPELPQPALVRCQKCGRDVSSEVSLGRSGDYICEACRRQAQADPIVLLKELLQGARKPDMGKLDIPDYEIGKELGVGGFGAVYLVRHKKQGTQAALKVMLPKVAVDDRARQAFLRETENLRTLNHQHIVKFLDCGSVGSIFYILLEYCESGNVDDLMNRRGSRLELAEAGVIMLQALKGLAFAHAKGFVHRDLKPHNILLTGKEKSWTAKIADMGLAKNFTQAGLSGMTATGSYAGSFPFMPREQVTNFKFVKPVSDVWSMGATFYNMLTGQYPRDFKYGQEPMEVILHGDIVPVRKRNSHIPKQVAEVIDRALSNKTGERYQDAGEMRRSLEKVL